MPPFAKDYTASLFGIYSHGVTLSTRSIQYAIDYIHKNDGGRLVFYVGRYLTGSIHLKSNVTLQLEEGAMLLGSLNPWDYDRKVFTALVFVYDQQNIGITGKGIIEGQGRYVARNVVEMIHKGILKDGFRYDRPEAESSHAHQFPHLRKYPGPKRNPAQCSKLGSNLRSVQKPQAGQHLCRQ